MFKEIKLENSRAYGDGAKSATLFSITGATGGSSGGSSSGGSSGNSSVSCGQSFSNMLNMAGVGGGGWSPHIPVPR